MSKVWDRIGFNWLKAKWQSSDEKTKQIVAIVVGFVLLAIVGLAFASPAHANGNHDKNSHHEGAQSASEAVSSVGDITVENTINVPGSAGALSDGAVQANLSSGDVVTGDQTVNINNPDDIKIKNTPDVRAPYMNTTSPCRVGISGGIGIAGFGGNAGTTIEDKECTLRQTAQTFSALGVPGAGLWLLCRSQAMERVEVTPDQCDAMIAQMQIEAALEVPEPVGKYLAQHTDDDYEELAEDFEQLESEYEATVEQLRREIRSLEKKADSNPADDRFLMIQQDLREYRESRKDG